MRKNMKKPIKVKKIAIGIGKAKDYPGIKKIIEMNKKGKKRFARGGKVKTQEEQPRKQGRSGLKPPPPGKKGKGLRRLPQQVRNKMGYMKKGGRVFGGGKKKWQVQVYMQTYTPKENVVVKCERKVQRVHQKHLTLREQDKQRGKNNGKTLSKR